MGKYNYAMATLVITPISQTYKTAGMPDSRRDYENQLARVFAGNKWMWDDARTNESVVGGIFGFVFNNARIEFRRITRVADPAERLPIWAENVGQGNRRVLFLGSDVYTMQWDEWRALGGMPKVQGSTYPRAMDVETLKRLLDNHI
jgi:hypothetical protein